MSDRTAPETPLEKLLPQRSFLEPRMPLDGKTILITGGASGDRAGESAVRAEC